MKQLLRQVEDEGQAIMKYQKPDGVIEIGSSGCCCPPGERRSGQHTNAGTSWIRINGGQWKRLQFGVSLALKLADESETVQDFFANAVLRTL